MFDYEIIALKRGNSRYIKKKITSESFRGAFYEMLKDDKDLVNSIIDIYCKKKNGDLQFMGVYDGLSVMNQNGEYKALMLKTADGHEYTFSENGFVIVT